MASARGRRATRPGQQDVADRAVWGERTDVEGAGSIMRVRTTVGDHMEVPVVNFGYSFSLPEDFNAEVTLINIGSDPNNMVAIPNLPRDLQFQWPEGTGGIQHPMNAERRLEFNGNETFLRDGTFVIGENRNITLTVDGDNVSISTTGNLSLSTSGDIALESATLTHNGANIGSDHTHTDPSGIAGNETSGPN